MLTITDFIQILQKYYRSPQVRCQLASISDSVNCRIVRCFDSATDVMFMPRIVCSITEQETHKEMRYPNVTSFYFATPLAFNAPDNFARRLEDG